MSLLPQQDEENILKEEKSLPGFRLSQRRQDRNHLPKWVRRCEDIARHFTAKLLQGFAILLVAGVPLLLMIAHFHGLGNGIRLSVEKALSGKFYDVKIDHLFFTIGDGLVADDLRILENKEPHRLLVHANKIALLPKLSALSRGNIEIEAFRLHHATIDVPLGNTEEPRLRLDHVEAKIICPPEQLVLSKASFHLCGIHVKAHGNFLNPKTFAPYPVASNGPGQIAHTIEQVQQELERIHWEGKVPLLEIEASGDLTQLETLRADHVLFHAGDCSYAGWTLNSISADLEYANQVLKLQQFSLEDHLGEMHLWGTADVKNQEATFNFSGACDVMAAATLAFPKNQSTDWTWNEAPHLEGSLGAIWKNGVPVFRGEAHVQAEHFSYRDVAMDHLSGGCIFDQGRFLLRDLDIKGTPGSLHGDLMIAPDDYRLRIKAALLPQLLVPAARGGLQKTLSLMNFKDPLQLTFEGRSPQPDPLLLEGAGTLMAGRSSMRDAWIDSVASDFQMKEGAIAFQNILLKIGEKKADGSCIYDIKNQEMRFPGIRSNVDPVTVLMWIDPHIADSLKAYRFHVSPEAQVSGTIGLKDPQKNNFKIQLKAPQGLDYTLIKRDLTFDNVVGTVLIKKQELLIDLPCAALFGGTVALNAVASIAPGDAHYGANAILDGVDFNTLAKLYFDYNDSQGKLSGHYKFKTMTGDDYAMTGSGSMLIKDGNVYAMPILGPLSVLMNDVIPGLGYQAANRATADFIVEKGDISTKNLSIQSAAFTMIGSGDIFYLEDRMNMSVRLNVRGLPGIVLFPVSKLFEYISDGSAKHPTWRSKFIPGLPGSSSK